jgi:hypothetical protein
MRRTLVIIPAGLALLVALAGCSAMSSGGGSSSADGPAGRSAEQGPQAQSGSDSGGAADGSTGSGTGGTAVVNPADRAVIVTGTVGVTVDSPLAAAKTAAAIVTKAGGRIDGREERAAGDSTPESATLTLRVPASKLDGVIDDLSALGTHPDVSTKAADVTGQVQDLDARISALQTTIARYEQLAGTAATTADLITIESAIGERQAELETLQAQQRSLDDQVSMSTLTLELRAPGVALPRTGPQDFGSAVATGWAVFVGFLTALVLAFGVLLPWLVLAGLVAAAIVLGVRRRRRRAAAAAAAGAAAADQSAARISASSANP